MQVSGCRVIRFEGMKRHSEVIVLYKIAPVGFTATGFELPVLYFLPCSNNLLCYRCNICISYLYQLSFVFLSNRFNKIKLGAYRYPVVGLIVV